MEPRPTSFVLIEERWHSDYEACRRRLLEPYDDSGDQSASTMVTWPYAGDGPTATLGTIVEPINGSHANVVVLKGAADGNTAWHIVLAGEERRRMVLLDMERGVARDYLTRTTAIDTL